MKRDNFDIVIACGAALLIFFFFILAMFWPVKAQDSISVCWDDTYPTPRFEFRNIPANWFEYDSGVTWGYWAGGVQMLDGVLIADALTEDTDGYAEGTATLNDYDHNLTWVGDATTAPCDVPPAPPVIPTAEPVITQIIMSTGRTCVVKYPEIVLVCNG